MVYFFWLATYLTHAWLVNDLWSNGHRFCLPLASLRVAMFLWETDTCRFGQVSCMLNLCASGCVHESGGMHDVDPLCAPQLSPMFTLAAHNGGMLAMGPIYYSPNYPDCALFHVCPANELSRRILRLILFAPSFTVYLDNRGEGKLGKCSPVEQCPLTIGAFYLLFMTAHGDMNQLYRDLCLIDSTEWAAEQHERNLKNKMSRTLAKLKGKEMKRIIAMPDPDFVELMSRSLSSPLPVPSTRTSRKVVMSSKIDPGPLGGAERGAGGKDSTENDAGLMDEEALAGTIPIDVAPCAVLSRAVLPCLLANEHQSVAACRRGRCAGRTLSQHDV